MTITQRLVAMEAPSTVTVTCGYLHCLVCDSWDDNSFPTIEDVGAFVTDHNPCECNEDMLDDPDGGEMDGDHASALASVGWGTDEDYGDYGMGEDW